MKTIHNGTVPINKLVKPEGTHCSAHTTAPCPPNNINPPTTNALRQ